LSPLLQSEKKRKRKEAAKVRGPSFWGDMGEGGGRRHPFAVPPVHRREGTGTDTVPREETLSLPCGFRKKKTLKERFRLMGFPTTFKKKTRTLG